MIRPAVLASTSNSVSPRVMAQVFPSFVHATSVGVSVVADVSDVVGAEVEGAVVVGVMSVVVGAVDEVTGATPVVPGVTGVGVGGATGGVTLGAPVVPVTGAGVVVVVLGVTGGGTTGPVDDVVGAGVFDPLSPQLMNAAERPATSQSEPADKARGGRKRMATAYRSRLADENASRRLPTRATRRVGTAQGLRVRDSSLSGFF